MTPSSRPRLHPRRLSPARLRLSLLSVAAALAIAGAAVAGNTHRGHAVRPARTPRVVGVAHHRPVRVARVRTSVLGTRVFTAGSWSGPAAVIGGDGLTGGVQPDAGSWS